MIPELAVAAFERHDVSGPTLIAQADAIEQPVEGFGSLADDLRARRYAVRGNLGGVLAEASLDVGQPSITRKRCSLTVIVALLAVLVATTSACTSGGHVDAADLNTVAAKTRGYVKQFTDKAGTPASRPFTEMTNFCGDDGNDESRTEYVYGGSVKPADSSTIEAAAKRSTTDGWKREDHNGTIYLRRDGYVIIVRSTEGEVLVDGAAPCAPTPSREDPLHPSHFGPGSPPREVSQP